MCDVGGHISSDMITWQCACCGAAIIDADMQQRDFVILGYVYHAVMSRRIGWNLLKKNGKKAFV